MEIVIIGAGGHAKVVVDIVEKRKELLKENISIYGVIDDNFSQENFLGYKHLGKISEIVKLHNWQNKKYIIAIGSNEVRKKISKENEVEYATLIHPTAIISSYVKIGMGTVVMAGVVVNSSVEVGIHSILNSSSTIDHDCKIGNYTHISPSVTLAGEVKIGNESWIGIGSTVIQGIEIGNSVIIGAGSVVIKDIADKKKAYGVPAKER
ncbi:MAG: acetyltransferase [Cetobacterium sp.]